MGVYRKLLDVNAACRALRNIRRLLIYGTCVRDEHPWAYSELSKGRVPLAVCMEEVHFNMVALKLASMLARVDVEEVVVLTVDGSPHCVQLHMVVEEVEKVLGRRVNRRHYVVEGGELIEVPRECVKTARYLSKILRLLSGGAGAGI